MSVQAQLRKDEEGSRLPDTVLEKRRVTSQPSLFDHCVTSVHQSKDAPKFRNGDYHSLGTEVLYNKDNICSLFLLIYCPSFFAKAAIK